MAAKIVELLNPAALAVPEVWALFDALFPEGNMVVPAGAESLRMEYADEIESNDSAIFIAYEGSAPVGMIHVRLPASPWEPEPTVMGWVNKGDKATGRALTDKVVEFLVERGHNRFRALNRTGKADSIWARSFRRVTQSAERVGSVMQFECKS